MVSVYFCSMMWHVGVYLCRRHCNSFLFCNSFTEMRKHVFVSYIFNESNIDANWRWSSEWVEMKCNNLIFKGCVDVTLPVSFNVFATRDCKIGLPLFLTSDDFIFSLKTTEYQ